MLAPRFFIFEGGLLAITGLIGDNNKLAINVSAVGSVATGASERAGGIVLNVPTGAAVAIGVGGAAASSDKTSATTNHEQTVTSSRLSRPFSQSLR